MLKSVFYIFMLLFGLNMTSQGLKGYSLGKKDGININYPGSETGKSTTLGGIQGYLMTSRLRDGTVYEIFFYSTLDQRYGLDLSYSEIEEFGEGICNHLNIQLQEYVQTILSKGLYGEWGYREFKGSKNGVDYLLRFGKVDDENKGGNDIFFWMTDVKLERMSENEKSNSKRNDY